MKGLFCEIAKDTQLQVSLLGSILGGLGSVIGAIIGVWGSIHVIKKQLNSDKKIKIESDRNTYKKMLKLLSSELIHNIDILDKIIPIKDDLETVQIYAKSLEVNVWEKSRFDIIEFMDDKTFEDILEGYRSLNEIKLYLLELNIQSDIDYELRSFYLKNVLEKVNIEIDSQNKDKLGNFK